MGKCMALVPAQIAAGGAVTGLAIQLAREAVQSLAREGSFGRKAVGRAIQNTAERWSNQQSRQPGAKQSKVKTPTLQTNNQSITMPKRVRNKVARPSKSSNNAPRISRGVPDSPVVSLTGVINSGNTGTGILAGAISLAINSALSGAVTLGSMFGTNLTNWATMYRQFRILRMRVTFVTGCPNTISGTYGAGIDADPQAGSAANYQSVVRHTPHFITPVFANAGFTWTPTSQRDKEDKFTLLGGRTDESEQSFGVLQSYSANSGTTGQVLGVIQIEATFRFSDPC